MRRLAFFLALLPTAVAAQIISLTNERPGWPVTRFDPESGAVVRIADTKIPGPWAVTSDPVRLRFFSFTGEAGSQQLTTTLLATGNVRVLAIPYPATILCVHYDVVTETIYAVTSDSNVLSLDPNNGVITSAFKIPPFAWNGYTGYNHAFDPSGRRFFILSDVGPGSGTLIAIDIARSTVSTYPVRWAEGFALGMQYDSADDRLLVAVGATSSPLLAVDTRSGATTQLLQMGVAGGAVGLTAFNPRTRKFFFMSGGAGSKIAIATVGKGRESVDIVPAPADSGIFWEYLPLANVPALTVPSMLVLACLLGVVGAVRLR